ncbi:MAG: transporter [Candidatus Saccharibacteria bacterium]|nr:transporter [Candidatus Saccharibacteria bacterium]
MANQTQAIIVNNIEKSYKKVSVLRGASFAVERGAIFALLGSNGAGKTTMINILTTLSDSDKGTAEVDGFDVSKRPEDVRKRISLTGQFAAVDDMLTARENLILIAELRHVENPSRTADELLKQFDLVDAADRRTITFSGGMRRRLDIAMGLIGNPSVIFFDEPTTGLDPQSRNAMWKTIKALAKKGTTVFLTTQYLEEADQLADKIAVLSQGKIVAEGTPQELKKLLPNGKIELVFSDQNDQHGAAKILSRYKVVQDDESYSLTIMTDGSISQIVAIFKLIADAHIEVTEFSQKTPTLDDVFLKIVSENEEKK